MIKPILSLLVIIFSLGFSLVYTVPAYRAFSDEQADFATLRDTIQQAGVVKGIIDQTKASMEEVTVEEKARFETFLPQQVDEIRLVNNLTRAAVRRGIALEGITVDSASAKKTSVSTSTSALSGVQKVFSLDAESFATRAAAGNDAVKASAVKVHVSFIASYPTVLLFVRDLEKSLHLMNITSLSLREHVSSDTKDASATALYQITLEIEALLLQ